MAGDWIKMRADLLTHPKVVRITSALKADRLRTVGGLMAVWCLFDAHSIDGKLDGYTPEALDDLIGWPGFSAAMVSVGWLENGGDSLSTPRFDEHNGQSAKRRATETERKRMARENADPSASTADKKRSREEKRREEQKTSEAIASAAAAAQVDAAEAVFALGLPLLTASGVSEKHSRSFLGRLRKFNGDGVILAAIDRCAKANAIQPVEFLQGCLKVSAIHHNRQEALEESNRAVGDAWVKEMQHAN